MNGYFSTEGNITIPFKKYNKWHRYLISIKKYLWNKKKYAPSFQGIFQTFISMMWNL